MHKAINSVARKLSPYAIVQASYTDCEGKHVSIEFDNCHAIELSETNDPETLEIQAFPSTEKSSITANIKEVLEFALQTAMLPVIQKKSAA